MLLLSLPEGEEGAPDSTAERVPNCGIYVHDNGAPPAPGGKY